MNGEPKRSIRFSRFGDLSDAPYRPLIEGLIYANTLGGITGRSGSGKTFLALGFAASIASGTPWMGRRVEQGAVFYISGEGHCGIKKRLSGWCAYNTADLGQSPLYISDSLPPLHILSNAQDVRDAIRGEIEGLVSTSGCAAPKLIIVDTLARAMSAADENDASDIGRFIEGMDCLRNELCCSVQVIHHTGHGQSQRARGSSAYYAALDSEILVTSTGNNVKLHINKSRDWEPPPDLTLHRNVVDLADFGPNETTLVLSESDYYNGGEQDEGISQVAALLSEGVSIREISRRTGISKNRVERYCKKLNRG